VAELEVQVRLGPALARYVRLLERLGAALYLGLGAIVLAWMARGAWFDAYDAALWLLAFATIEMNVLRKV
jgi:hypothetical protein